MIFTHINLSLDGIKKFHKNSFFFLYRHSIFFYIIHIILPYNFRLFLYFCTTRKLILSCNFFFFHFMLLLCLLFTYSPFFSLFISMFIHSSLVAYKFLFRLEHIQCLLKECYFERDILDQLSWFAKVNQQNQRE